MRRDCKQFVLSFLFFSPPFDCHCHKRDRPTDVAIGSSVSLVTDAETGDAGCCWFVSVASGRRTVWRCCWFVSVASDRKTDWRCCWFVSVTSDRKSGGAVGSSVSLVTERQSGGDIVHCVVSEWVSVTEGVCVTGGGEGVCFIVMRGGGGRVCITYEREFVCVVYKRLTACGDMHGVTQYEWVRWSCARSHTRNQLINKS